MKRWLVAAAVVLLPGVVHAETPPSVWERARDPQAAEAYDLHRMVQQRILLTRLAHDDRGLYNNLLELVKHAGGEKSKNPLLRFDLGELYFRMHDYPRAAQVYQAAIAEFPEHPALEQAWIYLAFSCGHTGDHACEQKAYIEVLRRETEEIERATPTLNLAETQMHLGDLKGAIEGYREALRIAGRVPTRETAPLATWGLAVALDRSGDRVAAEKEARFALEIERSMGLHRLLESNDVFFEPKYEINWYFGLGAAARARVASSSRDAATLWREAEKYYGAYVKGAEASKGDRWLPIAKARLAEAHTQRERAEKAAPREPTPPADSLGQDVKL